MRLVYTVVNLKIVFLQSSSMFRAKRCEDVLNDPIFKNSQNMKLLNDFTRLTEKLIELTEKPIGAVSFKNFVILELSCGDCSDCGLVYCDTM
jgi:hypothetical protein